MIAKRDAFRQEFYGESQSVTAFRECLNDLRGVLAERFAQSIDYLINGPVADDAGASPVNLTHGVDLLGADGLAKGAAGPGSVAVFSRSQYSVLDPSNDTSAFADATAISTIDDLVLTGSGQLNNEFFPLDLSGSMHVFGTTDVALSTLSISVKLNNQTVNDAFRTVQLPPFFFAV